MNFYEAVKELAKKKNTTVKTLVEGCGINYDSYNSCRRYGNLPRADEAVLIAGSLGVSVERLVTGRESSPAPDVSAALAALDSLRSELERIGRL